jgi:3-oxoacyl-[acyl-carrier protein] reductase
MEIEANGGSAEAVAVDVGDMGAVGAACAALLDRHGAVDILVNSAGITRDGLVARMAVDNWNDVIAVNLNGCFALTRGLCLQMAKKRWGRIINVASVIALVGNGGQSNYAASKAGVVAFTKSVAIELASRGVTVNAIAPGFIETDMTAALNEPIREEILKRIPMKTFGKADDVAAVAAFLASEESGYITGTVVRVDGGMVMT